MPQAYRQSKRDLTTLARDTLTNQVFLSTDPDVIMTSFLVIAFINWKPWELQTIGAVYERWSEAGPRSINGLPCFFSARFVHVNDMEFLASELRQMGQALGLVTSASSST